MATTMHVSDVAELLSEGRTHFNLSPAVLVEHSVRRNEASWLPMARFCATQPVHILDVHQKTNSSF